jgi:glycosyltransferase involved in cell wall biosynthesis
LTKLSIVLPAFNEAGSIRTLIVEYRKALGGRDDVELIVVDNGSTDDTGAALEAERAAAPEFPLRIVRIEVNEGYGHGIMTGLQAAKGEFLCWSHADLQCPAADPVRLFDAVLARANPRSCFGKGRRTNDRGRMSIFPLLQTWLSDIILGHHLEEINAQPKLFHRSFLDEFRKPPMGFELDIYAYDKAVLLGREIVEIDVVFNERIAGQSKWAYSAASFVRFLLTNFLYLVELRLRRKSI